MAQAYLLYCEVPNSAESGGIASQCPEAYRKEVSIDLRSLEQSSTGIPMLDPGMVSQVFGISFGVVVLFYLVGRGVGEVLRLIRHG